MTSLYSDKDKTTAIRKFIFARSKNFARIDSFTGIKECIAEGRIKLLQPLKMSGSYSESSYPYKTVYYYTEGDAQTYFEWLISVVAGTEDVSVPEEVFKKALNQLFMFIFGISGTLHSQVELLTPYSLDEHLADFKEKISLVEKKVDRINEQIVNTLEKIIDWQQKYQPYLNKLVKDQDSMHA